MTTKKNKVAMILAGAGHLDGSELRESIFSILMCDRKDYEVSFFAQNGQLIESSHLPGVDSQKQSRDILVESARVTRGHNTYPLTDINLENFDALILPGGFGMARTYTNLNEIKQDFSEQFRVLDPLRSIIKEAHEKKMPIVAICISPLLIASALGEFKPRLTIGNDEEFSQKINSLGGEHQKCSIQSCVVDKENLLISTAAYMYEGARISNVFLGIEESFRQLSYYLEFQEFDIKE